MNVDIDKLREYEKDHRIKVRKHPDADLYIANYTPKTVGKGLWDDVTIACRGLIFDGNGQVHARPFKKFFNVGEAHARAWPPAPVLASDPVYRMEVYEKMDGALGILYWLGDVPQIATRGSFTGPEAKIGTRLLLEALRPVWDSADLFNRAWTYCFEIIGPETRVCVDYGLDSEMVLLAVLDTETGKQVPWGEVCAGPYRVVERHDLGDQDAIEDFVQRRKAHVAEGVVVHFPDLDLRLKVKSMDYFAKHRLMTKVGANRVWEHLMKGHKAEWLWPEGVPQGYRDYVQRIADTITRRRDTLCRKAQDRFFAIIRDLAEIPTPPDQRDARKEFAVVATVDPELAPLLFALYDGNEEKFQAISWKLVHPGDNTPFVNEEFS